MNTHRNQCFQLQPTTYFRSGCLFPVDPTAELLLTHFKGKIRVLNYGEVVSRRIEEFRVEGIATIEQRSAKC